MKHLAVARDALPPGGIGRRLLVTLIGGLVVLNTITTVIGTEQLRRALIEAMREEIALAEAIVVRPVSSAVWEFDLIAARESLLGLQSMTYFAGARILESGEALVELEAPSPPVDTVVDVIPLQSPDGEVIATLELTFDRGPILRQVAAARFRTIVFGAAVLVLASLVVWYLSLSIIRPIRTAVTEIERLRDGQTDLRIESASRRDELGQVGRALDVLRRALVDKAKLEAEAQERDLADRQREKEEAESEAAALEEREQVRRQIEAERKVRDDERETEQEERLIRMREQDRVVTILADALRRVADGDLTHRLEDAFDTAYEPLRQDYNVAVSQLSDVVSKIASSADLLTAQAQAISDAAHDLSKKSEVAAAAVKQTRNATSSLSEAAAHSAKDSERFATLSADLQTMALEKREIVRSAVSAMDEIKVSSDEIGKVTSIIADIAFQTSLLSTNAGIEAARAGPAGAGFSVVASAVRELATQTADAAQNIEGSVSQRADLVDDGIGYIREADTALAQIGADIDAFSDWTHNISAVITAQADDVESINGAMVEVDDSIRESVAVSEDAARASTLLSAEADRLGGLIARFMTRAPQTQANSGNRTDVTPAAAKDETERAAS
ncbi:MAG: methyl-accepting chemotaxis protein [Pseudomonadota bacterium]